MLCFHHYRVGGGQNENREGSFHEETHTMHTPTRNHINTHTHTPTSTHTHTPTSTHTHTQPSPPPHTHTPVSIPTPALTTHTSDTHELIHTKRQCTPTPTSNTPHLHPHPHPRTYSRQPPARAMRSHTVLIGKPLSLLCSAVIVNILVPSSPSMRMCVCVYVCVRLCV